MSYRGNDIHMVELVGDCRHKPTLHPVSTLREIATRLVGASADFSPISYACPHCGLLSFVPVSNFRHKVVRTGDQDPFPGSSAQVLVLLECANSDCRIHVAVLAQTERELHDAELIELIATWKSGKEQCEKGWQAMTPFGLQAREWFSY